MADSLKDQLIKAGLATAQQAKKAERQKRAESQARRHRKTTDPQAGTETPGRKKNKAPEGPANAAEVRQRARQLNAKKAVENRALAKSNNDKAALRAVRAEIKQIVLQNDQRVRSANDDDVPYNFVHGKKIKKIHVPRAQLDQLSSGSLVIVNNDGIYHLLPQAAADQVAARDPKRIIVAHNKTTAATEQHDEHYAKFEVPDDLDW